MPKGFAPLTGCAKAAAILWCGLIGAGIGVWAVAARGIVGGIEFDTPTGELSLLEAANNLFVWYGAVMGLLWGAIFAKVQRSAWAWATASGVTIAVSGFLPYRIDGHMYEQANAIAFSAPLSFIAVQGLWLFPWRQRSWAEYLPDPEEED